MLIRQRNEWIWALTSYLVEQEGYALIHEEPAAFEDKAPIIHLLKNVNEHWHYVRLAPVEYRWPQMIERDMAESAQALLKKRSQLNYQPIKAYTLYVYSEAPSEEVLDYIRQPVMPHSEQAQFSFGWVDLDASRIELDAHWFTATRQAIEALLKETQLPQVELSRQTIAAIEERRKQQNAAIFQRSKPIWTYFFIAVNVIIFLLLSYFGSRNGNVSFLEGSTDLQTLIQFGAKSTYEIVEGQWWRLLTPIFLHIGITHLIVNSVALLSLGTLVEGIFGSSRFHVIYLLAGVAGNIASFLFSANPGAGASGAIFGLLGAMIYFVLHSRTTFSKAIGRDILIMLGINLVIGLVNPVVDNYAHLGGLLGGFLVAMSIGMPGRARALAQPLTMALLTLLIFGGSLFYGLAEGKQKEGYLAQNAERLYDQGDYKQAKESLNKLVADKPDNAEYWFQLGLVEFQLKNMDQSRQSFEQAVQINQDFAEAYYNLGVIAFNAKQYKEATTNFKEVLRIQPTNKDALELLDKATKLGG